jgi:D-beta-D-heptose 7-phosphate kinase/D-beta-D-heptose 1-phosphate adenosyltransferase
VPTRPRSVYDNTGAGDAVLAMLAAALVGGADLGQATQLANVAGGLEVEKFGCVPITAEEVLAELRLADRRRAGKLRSVPELINELKLRRDRGETVVFTNGCFDLLHAGHVDFLTRCCEEGSVLVVGINSDASIRAQNKGAERPINTALDRATVLGALACVDYVVVFDEPTPARIVQEVRPDVLVKGADWAERGVVGREFVESCGGRVVLLPLLDGYSTTSIVQRIVNAAGAHEAAARG